MGRAQYNYLTQDDFTGGINQDIRTARPNQVIDGRNVWCPDGVLRCRPGYQGVTTTIGSIAEAIAPTILFFEDTAVTPTTFSNSATADYCQVGDHFYFGDVTPFGSMSLSMDTPNTSASKCKFQYWNGTRWAYLPTVVVASTGSGSGLWQGAQFKTAALLGDSIYLFTPPNDWATTTVNAQTGYIIRGIVLDTDLAAVDVRFFGLGNSHDDSVVLVGLFSTQFQASKRVLYQHVRTDTTINVDTMWVENAASLPQSAVITWQKQGSRDTLVTQRASCAVIPEFNEAYVTYNYEATCHKAFPSTTDDITAVVENRDEYVGSIAGIKSPYHPDYIAQLGTFPQAQYLLWFQNQLWAFNLKENHKMFRWSAATDAATIGYRIWPEESFGVLADANTSPITGVASWNEHIVVFTSDSLWRVVLVGTSDIALNIYSAVKITGEVGCVSHSSIQNTPVGLIFLSEDGFYIYDGVRTRKISAAVDQTLRRANPSKQAFAAAVHWKSKNVYLCSVAVEGSDVNNLVFVYDYKHGACWLWDNISAQAWMSDEDQYDMEHIYFGDHRGRIYEMGVGPTDWGTAIEHWVRTHRLGFYGRTVAKSFREVYLTATNQLSDVTVKVIRQDEDFPDSYTLNFDDDAEESIDSFVFDVSLFAGKKYRSRRLAIRKNGVWAQVEIRASTANQPLEVTELGLGYIVQGRR